MPTYLDNEPFQLSPRFYQALQAKAVNLELDAHRDALRAAALNDPEHIARHNRLAAAQREEAARYRSFLAGARMREE